MKKLISLFLLLPLIAFAQGNTNRVIFSNPNNQFTGNGGGLTNVHHLTGLDVGDVNGFTSFSLTDGASFGYGFFDTLGNLLMDYIPDSGIDIFYATGARNPAVTTEANTMHFADWYGVLRMVTTTNGMFFKGLKLNTKFVGTSYQPTISDSSIYVTATGQTITMPTAVDGAMAYSTPAGPGHVYNIKLITNGTCTIATTNSEKIDGASSVTLTGIDSAVWLQSDGTNWQILGRIASSFTSTNAVLNTPSVMDVAHNLGTTPSFVRCVAVCVTNDSATGYVVGDEIDSSSWIDNTISPVTITYGANSTNVFIRLPEAVVGNEGNWSVSSKNGGGPANPTSGNNFRLKIYAKP